MLTTLTTLALSREVWSRRGGASMQTPGGEKCTPKLLTGIAETESN